VNKELLKKDFRIKVLYLLMFITVPCLTDVRVVDTKKKENGEMISQRVGIIISIYFGKMISPRE